MVVKWWHLIAASAICLAAGVLGTLAIVWAIDDDYGFYSKTDPGASRWHCDDVEVLATAVRYDANVIVQVTIRDEQGRTWQVRVRSVQPGTARVAPEESSEHLSVAVAAGDLDDGPMRRVAVRLVGAKEWCRGEVSLT